MAGGDQFARHAAAVARDLYGEPNKTLSTRDNLRFGRQGSKSVDLKTGQFYDHEMEEGGGVLWAIARETGRPIEGGEAVNWMREHGYDVEDDPRRAAPQRSGGGARYDESGNFIPARVPDNGKLTATYDYVDAGGELAYQVCRYDWTVPVEQNPKGREKTFVQRRPDASRRDGWNWSTKGVTPLPYRLPELLEDIASGYEVFIVEGEKKVDLLREQGVPATCNHGGAGKFPDELVEWFKGAKVVILPDNDNAGRDHRDLVGRKLREVAEQVRVLDLPGLPPKGGVDDWIPAGGTAEALYDLVAERATLFVPGEFRSRFGAVPFSHLGDPGPVFDYLVKGVLTKGEQSLLLGESQSGKSFVAIDMAMAVARGVEWFGRKTRRGGVIYQAGESAAGVRRRRIPAYMLRAGLRFEDPIPFVLLERPLDLYTDDAHVDQFIEECRYWATTFPVPLELITIDTFNKATPGANENDGKDMGLVLSRCDRIRQATGAHVQLVHHLNAGGTKARGHTSLFANVENVVTVRLVENAHDGDKRPIREWWLTKQKDGEDRKGERFVLPSVQIDVDGDGDPVTSCIVAKPAQIEQDANKDTPAGGVTVSDRDGIVLRAIYDAVREFGVPAPPDLNLPIGQHVVARTDVSKALRQAFADDGEDVIKDGETAEQAVAAAQRCASAERIPGAR